MTREEKERELRRDAGVDELIERFDAYIQRRQAEDQKQVIGRTYEPPTDPDDARQQNETIERIDREFEGDEKDLVRQDREERKEFDDWMRGQRIELRSQDAVQVRQTEERQILTGADREWYQEKKEERLTERERVRNEEEPKLRERFSKYQDQTHDDRLAALNHRRDENLAQLASHQKDDSSRGKSEQEKQMPWETEEQYQARLERARDRAKEPQQEEEPQRERSRYYGR